MGKFISFCVVKDVTIKGGFWEEQLNTVCAQVYAQTSLIERIYIDFTVVAAAATLVESSSEPT